MKSDDFQKLKDKIEQELKITEDNVMEKSIQLSNLYSIILKIYSKELRFLKEKILDKDKIFGELYLHYRHKFDYNVETKAEAETYIKADPKYYQIALECAQVEVQVVFLEKTLTHIDNLGFRIKNFVDLKKIKLGLM
jgi:hypothetical protein